MMKSRASRRFSQNCARFSEPGKTPCIPMIATGEAVEPGSGAARGWGGEGRRRLDSTWLKTSRSAAHSKEQSGAESTAEFPIETVGNGSDGKRVDAERGQRGVERQRSGREPESFGEDPQKCCGLRGRTGALRGGALQLRPDPLCKRGRLEASRAQVDALHVWPGQRGFGGRAVTNVVNAAGCRRYGLKFVRSQSDVAIMA